MNALLERKPLRYTFGPYRFHGRRLGVDRVRAMQAVIGGLRAGKLDWQTVMTVARTFGLKLEKGA